MTQLHTNSTKTFWIIGASSGIGKEVALELSRQGAQVIITARREEELHTFATEKMVVVPCDVTKVDSVRQAWDQIAQHHQVDVMIFSAAYWQQFDARVWDHSSFAQHIDVNLHGFNNVCAVLVPTMVARGKGMIVGLASVAGFRGLAGSEPYGMTKAGQINLLESLRLSLRSSGIVVKTICPGFVDTPLTQKNTFNMPGIISAERAAQYIVRSLGSPKEVVIFPRIVSLLTHIARWVPTRLWPILFSRSHLR